MVFRYLEQSESSFGQSTYWFTQQAHVEEPIPNASRRRGTRVVRCVGWQEGRCSTDKVRDLWSKTQYTVPRRPRYCQ